MPTFREGACSEEKIHIRQKWFYKQKQRYLAQGFFLDISAERSFVWKLKLQLVAHSLRQPQHCCFLDDYRQITQFKHD